MGQALHLGIGVHDGGHGQIENAAYGAHQIDDGVAFAAQGLGSHIRHQGHGGRAVGAHSDQQQAQHDDERHQLEGGGGGGEAVIQQRQDVQQDDGAAGTEEDEGHPLAQAGIGAVRDAAEDGQQEQGQHVIRRHDGAGKGLVQVEGVGQDQGDDAVIHLPEGADGQEGKAHQNGAFVIQLHL